MYRLISGRNTIPPHKHACRFSPANEILIHPVRAKNNTQHTKKNPL